MKFQAKERYTLEDLLSIMALLRGEGGCPWDAEQTHRSIRKNLIEEAYEVVEAIDAQNPAMLCEELGDLLMQVVFHSQMSREEGDFCFDDVADGVCKKLVHRHPHVFGQVQVEGSAQVLENWEAIKQKEKGQQTVSDTIHSVPAVLPALMRSQKVQKRAAKSGMDYPDAAMALADLEHEIAELKAEILAGRSAGVCDEMGDIIFSAVNVARKLELDAEECLTDSCNKFIRRFDAAQALAQEQQVDMRQVSLDRLNELWAAAKAAQG